MEKKFKNTLNINTQSLVPRTTSPESDPNAYKYYTNSRYYTTTGEKGLNTAILGNATSGNGWPGRSRVCNVLPNCVGYAQGRALEAWGPKFYSQINSYFSGNANTFDNKVPTSWKYTYPIVGSIGVLEWNHVFFVEVIQGEIVMVSESGWGLSNPAYTFRYTNATLKGWIRQASAFIIPPDVEFQTNLRKSYSFTTTHGNTSWREQKYEWRI